MEKGLECLAICTLCPLLTCFWVTRLARCGGKKVKCGSYKGRNGFLPMPEPNGFSFVWQRELVGQGGQV